MVFITHKKKNMNKVENPTLGLVFLTNFDMIDIAMKHCYERVFGKKTKQFPARNSGCKNEAFLFDIQTRLGLIASCE